MPRNPAWLSGFTNLTRESRAKELGERHQKKRHLLRAPVIATPSVRTEAAARRFDSSANADLAEQLAVAAQFRKRGGEGHSLPAGDDRGTSAEQIHGRVFEGAAANPGDQRCLVAERIAGSLGPRGLHGRCAVTQDALRLLAGDPVLVDIATAEGRVRGAGAPPAGGAPIGRLSAAWRRVGRGPRRRGSRWCGR